MDYVTLAIGVACLFLGIFYRVRYRETHEVKWDRAAAISFLASGVFIVTSVYRLGGLDFLL